MDPYIVLAHLPRTDQLIIGDESGRTVLMDKSLYDTLILGGFLKPSSRLRHIQTTTDSAIFPIATSPIRSHDDLPEHWQHTVTPTKRLFGDSGVTWLLAFDEWLMVYVTRGTPVAATVAV